MRFCTRSIALALSFVAASGAHAQQIVRIGHVGPVSGPNSHLGKDNENAARMAIDELNAKGFAINGQKVTLQLLAEDDASDPKQGTAVAQKLVDAKVNGVVGHLNSGTSVPASRIYHNAGLVQISPATTATQFTKQKFPGVFRVVANDAKLGGTLGKYAVETLKVKNIAVIDDRTTYGQGVAAEFAKAAKGPGVRIVDKQFTSATATDFTAILTAIHAKKPDLVFFGGMNAVAGPMLKQMKALGINARFMGGDGMCTTALGRLDGDAVGEDKVVCSEAGGVKGAQEQVMAAAMRCVSPRQTPAPHCRSRCPAIYPCRWFSGSPSCRSDRPRWQSSRRYRRSRSGSSRRHRFSSAAGCTAC